MELLSSGVREI